MNYAFQFPNPLLKRPLDYSRSSLLTLKEKNLNESSGISQSTPRGLMTVYGPGETRNATTGNPIHWNLDTDFDDANLPEDINYLKAIDGCDEKPNETLKGFDDWSHIIYDDALHKPHKNTVANILSKLPSITSSLESSNFSPIMISNGSSTTRHNESDVANELTSYDIKRLNLQLASTLKDTISNLSDTSFQQYPQNSILSLSDKEKSKNSEAARSYYEDKIGNTSLLELTPYNESRNTSDTTITGYIKSDKIDNAISSLNALLPTMDSSTGGIGSNDKIVNSSSQQHIAGLIDNAVEILKHQTCTYSNCTIIKKAPNATIEY